MDIKKVWRDKKLQSDIQKLLTNEFLVPAFRTHFLNIASSPPPSLSVLGKTHPLPGTPTPGTS